MKFPFEISVLAVASVLVACCVAPAFMAGLAATSLGWLVGFGRLEIAGMALGATVVVLLILHFRKTGNSKLLPLNERPENE